VALLPTNLVEAWVKIQKALITTTLLLLDCGYLGKRTGSLANKHRWRDGPSPPTWREDWGKKPVERWIDPGRPQVPLSTSGYGLDTSPGAPHRALDRWRKRSRQSAKNDLFRGGKASKLLKRDDYLLFSRSYIRQYEPGVDCSFKRQTSKQ